jgi:LEM3 (ligand-effect modulator 3) family / CDC50 family
VTLTYSADTISNPVNTAANTTYTFSNKGIAWPGEKKKYSAKTDYKLSEIVPPPNWALRYPNGYTAETFPDLTQDEHFQNWMRTAGLPTFSKLYGRNDNDDLKAGTYTLDVYMSACHCLTQMFDSLTEAAVDFPVEQFGGTKSVVISTVSWIGGKNPFLGWAYIASAALFVLLAVIGLIWHCIKPRFVHLPLLLLRTAHQRASLQQTRGYEPALVEPATTVIVLPEYRCRLFVW